MHLHDLMGWDGPMTHRQFLAWQAWQRMDIEQPQRAEIVYAMQTAQAAGGYKVPLQDHAIPIVTVEVDKDGNEITAQTPKQQAAAKSKAMKSIVSAATGSKWN